MLQNNNLLIFLPLMPLMGFLIMGSLALWSSRRAQGLSEKPLSILGVVPAFLTFFLTGYLAWTLPSGGAWTQTVAPWIQVASLQVNFAFHFDALTRIMLLFITGIGALIVLYSVGYMHGDRGFARFFAYLNLFLFSMIVLVLSDNLLLTFLGWEGVGLCSYLLIGFWNKDPLNGIAANKAFQINRVGDLGFLLAMFAVLQLAGPTALSYAELREWLLSPLNASILSAASPLLWLAAIGFFFAATAKSAQIPLLTWLPDAMAGPTPVSALIHAATMVTSGIYLLARLSDLYILLPDLLLVIACIGMATAFWAACVGLWQNDIKKVLAYSTVSQLGYMFLAIGCGAFDASLFHVFTHAFFKAGLFLAAGAVIHALHGEQDIRQMGGLARKLPWTTVTLVATWAAIIGLPGTAGFWSKDLILERVYSSSPVLGPVLFAFALGTALLTALYMSRLLVLTLLGKPRGHHHDAPHEAPWSMRLPMLILAMGALLAGLAMSPIQAIFANSASHHEGGVPIWVFALSGTLAAVIGAVLAFLIWKDGPRSLPYPLQVWTQRWTYAFDQLQVFSGCLLRGASRVMHTPVQRLSEDIPHAIALAAQEAAQSLRSMQAPSVRIQLGFSLAGALLLALVGGILL